MTSRDITFSPTFEANYIPRNLAYNRLKLMNLKANCSFIYIPVLCSRYTFWGSKSLWTYLTFGLIGFFSHANIDLLSGNMQNLP